MEYSDIVIKKLNSLRKSKKYIEMMCLLAEVNGGELLSKEYIKYNHQYEFLFIKGDKNTYFTRSLNVICKDEKFKYSYPQSLENIKRKNESKIDKFKKIKEKAKSLGGELLEKEWLGCSKKHHFKLYNEDLYLTPKEVYRSGLASSSRGLVVEPIIKQVFEHLFGYKFNKTRKILTSDITKTKSALELDGYCHELKIAFEYQGHPSHWKKDHPRYKETINIDKMKSSLCKELGIILIVIDNIKVHKYSDSDFFIDLIINKCNKVFLKENKAIPAMNKIGFKIDMSKTHHYHLSLENLKNKAKEKGFKLIDNEWKGPKYIYSFIHVKTGKIIKMTSLRVNHHERGLPLDIEKFLKIEKSKDKKLMLEKFKLSIESVGFTMIKEKWLGISALYEIKHNITDDIIEIKPSNIFYNKINTLKRKYDLLLKQKKC